MCLALPDIMSNAGTIILVIPFFIEELEQFHNGMRSEAAIRNRWSMRVAVMVCGNLTVRQYEFDGWKIRIIVDNSHKFDVVAK